MNNNSIPTIDDLTEAGYTVNITHLRFWDTAGVRNGKLFKESTLASVPSISRTCPPDCWALRAKGGATEVIIGDPVTGAILYALAICRDDENYNRKTGVEEALKRAKALMILAGGNGMFSYRLQ